MENSPNFETFHERKSSRFLHHCWCKGLFTYSIVAHFGYYRSQTKLRKGYFLHLSVILFTGGGVSRPRPGGGCPGPGPGGCIPACTEADTPQQTATAEDGTHPTGMHSCYRSGTVNSNTVNSKFHLIRSCCEYLARFLSFHV